MSKNGRRLGEDCTIEEAGNEVDGMVVRISSKERERERERRDCEVVWVAEVVRITM
jgi:hypothetical protein